MGAGRLLVSPAGMLGGSARCGRYLGSGLAQTGAQMRGVVAVVIDGSDASRRASRAAQPATGSASGRNESGRDRRNGRCVAGAIGLRSGGRGFGRRAPELSKRVVEEVKPRGRAKDGA